MLLVERTQTIILYVLVFMLLVSVVLGTVELGRQLVQIVLEPPLLLIDPVDLSRSFGLFLIILVGIELLNLLTLHLSHDRLRPELVIEVAIIAVCSKVVTLDLKSVAANLVVALSALLFALAAAYYVFAMVRVRSESPDSKRGQAPMSGT
jgi:uncharacterized membrane protein (DUF373 family)